MKNSTNIKIAKKYEDMIREIYCDEDGYWVCLNKGYYAAGVDFECHTIHEDEQKEVIRQIRLIKPCKCNFCNSK